jgi:glutamate-1-semialdehyde 2,1-aminomutase
VARAHTRRDQVLICGGYHGWADWCCERNAGIPQPAQWRTTRLPFGYQGMAFDTMKYAAVIVEPDRDPDYLRWLRGFCHRTGALLIFDEVITGFRYSLGGAQKHFDVTPDLACFGKAMANGMPLSAVVGKREYMRNLEPPDNVFFSGTFFGETLSLAAAIATIDKLERERGIEQLWDTGYKLRVVAGRAIQHYGLQDTVGLSGEDPYARLTFNNDDIAALFRREMAASGTLIIGSHNVSTAIGPAEIKRVAKSYDRACEVIKDAITSGKIKELLDGASVTKGVR